MQFDRLPFAALAIAGLLTAIAPATSDAQHSIKAPIRIIIAFEDEGSFIAAKAIGDSIAEDTRQPVIIDRKPGATGRIAAEALKNAAPDGQTLLLVPIAVPVLAPLVFRNIRYDPVKDFAPVAQVATFRYAWAVGPKQPARTVAEFVARAKANPASDAFGTGGAGSIPHFLGVMIGQATGPEMTHVPYKGAGPMSADLMGGQIAFGIDALANLIELHRAGRIRILAISGTTRSSLLPDVPTFAEQGFPTVDATGWVGVYAPAKTPKALIDRYSAAIARAVRTPEVRERFRGLSAEPTGTTPEELAAIMAADAARWAPIIKAAGFSAD